MQNRQKKKKNWKLARRLCRWWLTPVTCSPLVKTLLLSVLAVMFAYEQCLLVLGHHPDIWYEAAQYLEQSSKLLAEKGV